MKLPAYSAIAGLFEDIVGEDYDVWAEYILSKLKRYAPNQTGADVGCGSGAITRRLKRAGYEVFGCDVSDEMLAAAVKRAGEEGLPITFVKQRAESFSSLKKLGFIVSVNDCINYLAPANVKRAFSKFSLALSRGGLLVFDISTEYKIKNILGNNLFGDDEEDYCYLWFNRQTEGGVEMDITLFTREGGLFRRSDERHVQYAHPVGFLKDALLSSGFEVVSVEGMFGAPFTETSERAVFTAIKK